MPEELKENAIYTTDEVRSLLKVSKSTIKRLLKQGILRANKVGGQYRVMGKEILRLISPELEKKSVGTYLRFKARVAKTISRW